VRVLFRRFGDPVAAVRALIAANSMLEKELQKV
jgi:hypothetical protein